jgi:hypothetical protein
MRKRTLAACVSAIGAAGAVAVGTTVATAAPSAQTEYIKFLSTSESGTSTVVIANGPLHARGRDVTITQHRDRLVFPDGDLLIRHTAVSRSGSYDRTTCYGHQTESGTYTVLSGTGKYAHASGRGIYHLNVQIVGCSHTQPAKVFMFTVDAHGPLSY